MAPMLGLAYDYPSEEKKKQKKKKQSCPVDFYSDGKSVHPGDTLKVFA